VSNWRHDLVDWVLDYLTDLTAHSIYRLQGRWPVNLELARWRPEKEEVTGARAVCLSAWQAYRQRASNMERFTTTCEASRHVASDRKAVISSELI
jgi:hypothetical protein